MGEWGMTPITRPTNYHQFRCRAAAKALRSKAMATIYYKALILVQEERDE
jgi:hypothetical protein